MPVETIYPESWQGTRGVMSPAKKIDLGDSYLIFVSGQQASKNENHEVFSSDVAEQAEDVFKQINEILKAAGADMKDVVKSVLYFTDLKEDFKKVSAIRDKWFSECNPVSTCVGCNGFSRKGAKIEIEVTAVKEK